MSTTSPNDIPSSVTKLTPDASPAPVEAATATTTPDIVDKGSITCDSNLVVIVEPLQHDILCGQDKTWSNHFGNQLFRNQIMDNLATYRTANKKLKMTLTKQIITTLKCQYNARFIRPAKKTDNNPNDVWEVIPDQLARDKVSHALRFALKQSNKTGTSTSLSIVSSSTSVSSTSSICSKTTKAIRPVSKLTRLPLDLNFNDDEDYPDDLEPLPISASILLPPTSNIVIKEGTTCNVIPEENNTKSLEDETVVLFRRQQEVLDLLKHPIQNREVQQEEVQHYAQHSLNDVANHREGGLADAFDLADPFSLQTESYDEENTVMEKTTSSPETHEEEAKTNSYIEPFEIGFHSLAIFDDLVAQPLMILDAGCGDLYSDAYVATAVPEAVMCYDATVQAIDVSPFPMNYPKKKQVDAVTSYYQDVVAVATVMDLEGNSIAGSNPPKLHKMVPPPIPFGKKFGAPAAPRQKSDESFDLSFLDRLESMSSIEGLRSRTRSMDRIESTSSSDGLRTRTMSLTEFNIDWIVPPPIGNNSNSKDTVHFSSNNSVESASMT